MKIQKERKMIKSKYFSESEFERCNPPCSLQDMKQDAMDMFDKARELAGIPFVINSAYRTVEHEKARKRAGTSAHTLGRAIDIQCQNESNRFKILTALLDVGFTRIGVYDTFIHADNSTRHVQKVIW